MLQHEYKPVASSWQQKQEADRRTQEARDLKDSILEDRDGSVSPEQAAGNLDTYEKQFAEQSQARAAQAPTDYGSANYMAELGDEHALSTVPAFTQAASAPKKENSDRTDSEVAETNVAPAGWLWRVQNSDRATFSTPFPTSAKMQTASCAVKGFTSANPRPPLTLLRSGLQPRFPIRGKWQFENATKWKGERHLVGWLTVCDRISGYEDREQRTMIMTTTEQGNTFFV